jgi:hypothetical protein
MISTNTPQGQLLAVIKELRAQIHGLLLERRAFEAEATAAKIALAQLQAKYDALVDLKK